MANMDFCDKHNMVAFLQKPTGSEEFHQMVDFLAGSHIRYALTTNLTIYVSLIVQFWQIVTVDTVNDGEQQLTVTDNYTVESNMSLNKIGFGKTKRDEKNMVILNEYPRLVAKGYAQKEGNCAFEEFSFAPLARSDLSC
ncbi:hypothetical protein Tco_1437789 [Tanacetum coccineum]